MTANLYDDDPVRDAEMAAEAWAQQHVGRHRRDDSVIEPDAMADLVSAHLAYLDGDRDLADMYHCRAKARLYEEGHTAATAMATIHHVMPVVKAQALEIRAGVDALATVANVHDLMRRAQHG